MKTTMNSLVILAALTALAAPAAAQPAMDVRNVVVRTADLDLAKPADLDRLASRVRIAAMSACGGHADTPELGAALENRMCRDKAVAEAIRELNTRLATQGSTTRLASR